MKTSFVADRLFSREIFEGKFVFTPKQLLAGFDDESEEISVRLVAMFEHR